MSKTYIVAEMSANHNHDLQIALDTIAAAKRCGADAIKIQTYTADTITLDCDRPEFMAQKGSLWEGETLHGLYQKAYTPWEWHEAIFEQARKVGIVCFSSPFDRTAVDLLESLGNPIYKIASFEITDTPLVDYVARTGKPIIISTGIATIEDIELVLDTCYKAGNEDVTLLKCTSAYPSKVEDANLATILDMRARFGVKVGLSDHSMGHDVAVTAVALGAEVVEKHFILDHSIGGPDAAFSMDETEFAAMVTAIRATEAAIGRVDYPTDPSSVKGREFCRSLYVTADMKRGDILTAENLRSIRPGYGLHPKYVGELLGRAVNRDVERGEPMSFDFVDER